MDALMQTSISEEQEPNWDLQIDSEGQLKFCELKAEEQQRAVVSAFLQKGTIPQMTDTGVDWTGMLTGEVSPAEINSQILDNIHNLADSYAFTPHYSTIGDTLYVTIKETSV